MKRRETQETVDVKTLTKRAISLYLEQTAGEEVDPNEIAQLREDTHLFPEEREFKDFRVAVGTTALQGKFKFGEKDAGSEIMGILFGLDDALLYDAVVTLSRALDMSPRDYTITAMLNIHDELNERLNAGDADKLQGRLKEQGHNPEDLDHARRALEGFLSTKAGAGIREQMLLRQEVARAGSLMDEVEDVLARPRTTEEIGRELQEEKDRIQALWGKLKEEPFELAPLTVRRMMHSRTLVEELQRELKHTSSKKRAKQPDTAVEISPEEEVVRKWAVALKRSAHQLRLDAEEKDLFPEEAEKLQIRAAKYEAEANRLLAGLHISTVGVTP